MTDTSDPHGPLNLRSGLPQLRDGLAMGRALIKPKLTEIGQQDGRTLIRCRPKSDFVHDFRQQSAI
jgi:hypothetical protein